MKPIRQALALLCTGALLFSAGCGSNPPAGLPGTSPEGENTTIPTAPITPVTPPASDSLPVPDQPIESPVDSSRVTFAAAGDNLIHEAVYTDAKNRADVLASTGGGKQNYAFSPMYAGIAGLISGADLAFVNQESPISSSFAVSGYPDFNSPSDAGRDLLSLGFNVINLANNHMLDMGERGLSDSIDYWRTAAGEAGATVLGDVSRAAYDTDNVRIIEVKGVKIAMLSYTTLINYAHASALSASSTYVVPYAKDADIKRQMALARQSGADLIFVSMHWGDEGKFTPNAEQKRLAQLLADEGADVVIGNHSHTLQPIEWLDGREGGRTLVAYSMGNLISTMLYSYYMVGGILTFDIVREEGEVYVDAESVLLVPIVTHYSMNRDSLQIYRLADYTEALAAAHGAQKNGAFTLATLKKYVTDTIAPEFLPQ